ncbi:MAG: cupin domain-containing protein [Candidatus Brocadia sp.]|nr:cupin domain-containing protein [Candidatus Brocadia sp.]
MIMSHIKPFFCLSVSFLVLVFSGCTTVKYYPGNFVESLQHPTKFPVVFSADVQNIEEIANKNPLGEDEDVKITDVGENKNSSMHLIQVRENGELRPHYHKRHDEVIYVKKGSGIATLNGTRYLIKPGSILQVPGKTVHKFLNTGSEQFMAVSIISPPFDGRDEKIIKEKKKAGRHIKEEKRLATKKPEKTEEKRVVSDTNKEDDAEEIGTPMVKSDKVAVKKLNRPVPEEWDYDAEKPSLSSRKISPQEGKKKQENIADVTEPATNLEDVHEKLAKLVELREEGTISAEEYEEKKDALVGGRDIGDLPELKGHAKGKMPVEDESVLDQALLNNDISDENQDTVPGTPDLVDESEPAEHEVASEEKESLEDKLKILEEMRQENLITEEDYADKKKELVGIPEREESGATVAESINSDERIQELKELYDQELITEEDYKHKLKELTEAQDPSPEIPGDEEQASSLPSNDTIEDERISELKALYDEGLLTQEDYAFKLKELTGAETQNSSPGISPGNEIKNEKVSELNELKEQGLISEEDYEFKKAQLLGN